MRVCFVGAGPGDPELITVKGHRFLLSSSIIIYAGSLVNKSIIDSLEKGKKIYNSANMTLGEITKIYLENRQKDGIIVRLHTGDTSIYSAIQEQIDFCEHNDIPFEIVPGVSSFSGAASAINRELTLPGISQTIVISRVSGRTGLPEGESLDSISKIGGTIVLFLSIDKIERIAEKMAERRPAETPVCVIYRATWPDQRILRGTLENISKRVKESGIKKHALVIIGRVLDCRYEKSKLYDENFSHGCRSGE